MEYKDILCRNIYVRRYIPSCQQTFLALGQAKISLFLALLRKVILLVPLIFIFPMILKDKLFGVLLAGPIADIKHVLQL